MAAVDNTLQSNADEAPQDDPADAFSNSTWMCSWSFQGRKCNSLVAAALFVVHLEHITKRACPDSWTSRLAR